MNYFAPNMNDLAKYLQSTRFIDFNDPAIQAFTQKHTEGLTTNREKAVALYYAVRDEIVYSPWHLVMNPDVISASITLKRGVGYCIEKSLVLAACTRFAGIPSRLGFSIVRNHLSTKKFVEMLKTDKFVFHGYNEFLLDGEWVKCTPAFNKSLCEKFNTKPLDFDGHSNSIFQEFSPDGRKYMEYLHEYGTFDDFPYDLFYAETKKHYRHLFESKGEAVFAKEEDF
ncbi:MAG: transglutaminase family protein [Chitinophagales bacterium]|nr:transglutaminase family protein [Chitinophagales bacterium]